LVCKEELVLGLRGKIKNMKEGIRAHVGEEEEKRKWNV